MKIRCFIINIAVASMIFFAITVVMAGDPPLLSIIQEDRYVKGQTGASNQQYGVYDNQKQELYASPGEPFQADIVLNSAVRGGTSRLSSSQLSQIGSTFFKGSGSVTATGSRTDGRFCALGYSAWTIKFSLNKDSVVTFKGSVSGISSPLEIYSPENWEAKIALCSYLYGGAWAIAAIVKDLNTLFDSVDYVARMNAGNYIIEYYAYAYIYDGDSYPHFPSQSSQSSFDFTLTATPLAPCPYPYPDPSGCCVPGLTALPDDETNKKLNSGWVDLQDLDLKWGYGDPNGLLSKFKAALSAAAGGRPVNINSGYRTCKYQNHLWEIVDRKNILQGRDWLINHPECCSLWFKTKEEYAGHYGDQINAKVSNPYYAGNKAMHTSGSAIDIDIKSLGLSDDQIRTVLNNNEFKGIIGWGSDIYTNKSSEAQHFELIDPIANPCGKMTPSPKPCSDVVQIAESQNPSPSVQVKVKREYAEGHVVYYYTVINKSTEMLTAFYIGYDDSTYGDELLLPPLNYSIDNPSPADSFISAAGWEGMVLDVLDSPYFNLFWYNSVEGSSIPPEGSLSGFKVILPQASEEYAKGHFTAILTDGSKVSGPLQPSGKLVPYELLLLD